MQPRRKNLILISLDTLRADVAYSGRLGNLEALRASGTTFQSVVASAPITPISHASVFTSLQPCDHGIRHLARERLETAQPTLAELFAVAGYETGAIVSCPGLHRWYGMDRGFAHYDDEIPRLADGRDPLLVADVKLRGTASKRAPLVVERALEWLEPRRHRPFFLFVHFFDTHWPYDPPEWFAPPEANAYEGEAHFADHYLGHFLDQVRVWGLDENTLIVAFSDHGEDLAGWYANDHGGSELGHPEENGHGCLLFDATQMVPLVLVAPGLVPARAERETQVRLIDILPTITDLLGLDDPAIRSGVTLTDLFQFQEPGPHRPAYFETYYREEQAVAPDGVKGLGPLRGIRIANAYKVIEDVSSGRFDLYNLEHDPCERSPVAFHSRSASAIHKAPRPGP